MTHRKRSVASIPCFVERVSFGGGYLGAWISPRQCSGYPRGIFVLCFGTDHRETMMQWCADLEL